MIFDATERLIAFRYLRAKRRESVVSAIAGFSLVGIGLGVATLIIVLSVMGGFRQDLTKRILGLNPHASVETTGAAAGPFAPDAALIAALAAVPGVTAVAPAVEGQVMLTGPGGAQGALLRGLPVAALAARPTLAGAVTQGDLGDLATAGTIVLGSRLAARFGVGVGDGVTVIAPRPRPADAPETVVPIPAQRRLTVAAIFRTGLYDQDSGTVFTSLETAQNLYGLGGQVSRLEVETADPRAAPALVGRLAAAAGADFRAADWGRANAGLFTALQVERVAMFVILTLILLVAAFNIVSGLVMLVKDKGRDIAILRTMGATRGMILRVFLLSGASVGLAGTLAGAGIGLLIAGNIDGVHALVRSLQAAGLGGGELDFFARMPAVVNPVEVALVLGLGIGLSLGATIYPSWRAARLDPVEALRHE